MFRPHLQCQSGLTLTELAVAMAAAGILLAAGYGIFLAQQKTYAAQDQVVEIQQNARVAMNLLARDLRMAGHGQPDGPVTVKGVDYRDGVTVDGDGGAVTLVGCFGAPAGYLARTALQGDTQIDLVNAGEFDTGDKRYIFVGEYDKAVISHIEVPTLTLSQPLRKRYPTARLNGDVSAGADQIRVRDASHVQRGDILTLGDERLYVTGITGDTIEFDTDPATPLTQDPLRDEYPSGTLVNPIPVYRVQVLRYDCDGHGSMGRKDLTGNRWTIAENIESLSIEPRVPNSPTYDVVIRARAGIPDEAGRCRTRSYAFTISRRNP